MVRWVLFVAAVSWSTQVNADFAGRISVIDGDTFKVGRVTVRLHGVDAPEQDQTCTNAEGQSWPCGAWVTAQVRHIYQGQIARCSYVTTDRYNRTVATCVVNGFDIGENLVSQGLVMAYRRYSMSYDLVEKQAAAANRGLHATHMQDPAEFRKKRVRGIVGRQP